MSTAFPITYLLTVVNSYVDAQLITIFNRNIIMVFTLSSNLMMLKFATLECNEKYLILLIIRSIFNVIKHFQANMLFGWQKSIILSS
ncbi:hypothetical protein AAW52_22855 [Vibrio diabolicus]|nr:hypothetical protein AAW52_22855 [Vibrio diabolicus]